MHKLSLAILVLLLLVSCGGGSSGSSSDNDSGGTELNPEVPPITSGNWYKPSVLVTWQWQLQGAVNTSYNVDIYDIDLFDSSAALI